MPKRSREGSDDLIGFHPVKRNRNNEQGEEQRVDYISSLSSELLLHILSFLPMSSLNICQRLSHRFYLLAGDSELWKRQYYSRWVNPRVRRLANVTSRLANSNIFPPHRIKYSPKVSTWLGHGHLAEEGRVAHWKTEYRLKHNWSNGVCRVTEVQLPEPPQPPFLGKLCLGFMMTVDAAHGLRVCISRRPACCVARALFGQQPPSSVVPTALTAAVKGPGQNSIEVTVGFQDGHFRVYDFDVKGLCLSLRYYGNFTDGAITCIASSPPYLQMISGDTLSLYEMPPPDNSSCGEPRQQEQPRVLASLKAESLVAPMTVSVRAGASEIISSIVYSFFHLGCGWSLGIQELRFSRDGKPIGSRLTTTVDSQYGNKRRSKIRPRISTTLATGPCILHRQPPTSMSYSHPYLLTSHADNTLTMYLVVSTGEDLFVKCGRRLWGHTSAISTVQVTDRGKAVSVSSTGDEMRVWDLETIVSDENSIPITPENKVLRRGKSGDHVDDDGTPRRDDGLALGQAARLAAEEGNRELEMMVMRGCVGFDEERVMLFRGKEQESPWLECYDFT